MSHTSIISLCECGMIVLLKKLINLTVMVMGKNKALSKIENSVGPDQIASSEAS